MTKGLMLRHGSQPLAALFPDALHPLGLLPFVLLTVRDALRSSVEGTVRVFAFQRKVLRAVVGLVAVQVVHYLAAFQGAAKNPLHHVAVLKDIALMGGWVSGHPQHDVTEIVDVASLSPLHAIGVVARPEALPPETPGRYEIRMLPAPAFAKAGRIDLAASKGGGSRSLAARSRAGIVAFTEALAICDRLPAAAFTSHDYSITGLGGDCYD